MLLESIKEITKDGRIVVKDGFTKDNLVGKRVIVNAGKYKNAPVIIIDLGGGANGATIKMDSGEKAWIARVDFEVKDSVGNTPKQSINLKC